MNLSLKIARRYLFAKKSTNAINIITGIAVFGIAVGTAALVLVLSVFNGFEDLITGMYSKFNPDVKIIPAKGKTFETDSTLLLQLRSVDGVRFVSQTLEEVAFFEYRDNQDFGILKGVDEYFNKVTGIDSTVREGAYGFVEASRDMAVLGLGMRNKLAVNVDDLFSPMGIYMPKRRETGLLEPQFYKRFVYPGGTFVIQQDFDNQYVLTSLEFARGLMGFDSEVSALELRLTAGANQQAAIQKVRQIMGPDFVVKDRYQQEEAFLKLMKIEKWLSYAIVSLMMLMVAFNMVGALWMIVLEKQPDISILKSMGAPDNTIRNIFLNEGFLLCLLGIASGFFIAIAIYTIQKTVGIVSIPGNFIVEAYPISMRLPDFLIVTATVVAIGLLASVPPAIKAKGVPAIIREE
jgi:lipoprotein-releasing system permease protein